MEKMTEVLANEEMTTVVAEEIATAGCGTAKVIAGVVLGTALVGGLAYKFIIKPKRAKRKAESEPSNVIEADFGDAEAEKLDSEEN